MRYSLEHLLQEVLMDEATLSARVNALGEQISNDYAGANNLLLSCILKGGVMFLTDLMRSITVRHEIDLL